MNTNLKTVIIETSQCPNGFELAAREEVWPAWVMSFGTWDKRLTQIVAIDGKFLILSSGLSHEIPGSFVVREIYDEGKVGEWVSLDEILVEAIAEEDQDAAAPK